MGIKKISFFSYWLIYLTQFFGDSAENAIWIHKNDLNHCKEIFQAYNMEEGRANYSEV